ncbi:MAG: hypothetical protein J6C33_09155, partial [Lachnospiraceae bacterium]|nr:hypothetical protein [Lachnospiraceae bacterium]
MKKISGLSKMFVVWGCLICLFLLSIPVKAAPADIGAEGAKQAVRLHSGLSEEQMTVVKLERENEKSGIVYEVDFLVGNYLFRYEID